MSHDWNYVIFWCRLKNYIYHMTMVMLFSNSDWKTDQNDIKHHYIPFMVSHMTTLMSFFDLDWQTDENGI